MSFVDQEDIFSTTEPLFFELFTKFGNDRKISKKPFQRISFAESMLKYGTDKPDLRIPIEICDVTNIFNSEEVKFDIFKKQIK